MVEAIDMAYFTADFYRGSKRKRGSLGLVDALFQKYAEEPTHKCRSSAEAAGRFHRNRNFLLAHMKRGEDSINWKITAIFEYLTQGSPSPSMDEMDRMIQTPEDTSRPARLAGKGKSSLRLPSGRASMKAAARREAQGDPMDIDESPGTASPLKRKSIFMNSSRLPKRRQLENADGTTTQATSDDDGEDGEESLPLRSTVPDELSNRESLVQIMQEPLLSFEAKGPGDTWICDFDGCSHKVYAASKPKSKELIRDHYRTHATESQSKLDLIMKEERPYLPVSNLVRKIRELASQHRIPHADDERDVPKPIKRRY